MITVIHNQCGKPAFYFRKKLMKGERVCSSNVIQLDGTSVSPHTRIICGSCFRPIESLSNQTLSQKKQHWSDWFLLEEDKWKQNKL